MGNTQGKSGKGGGREAILAAATDLFNLHGVQAVTTRQIAQRVGISQPSIYAHFGSVQQIQDEVSARAFALLERRAAMMEDADPKDHLRGAIQSYFDFGLNDPQAYRIAFMLEHPNAAPDVQTDWDLQTFLSIDHPGPRAFGHFLQIMARVRPDLSADALLVRTQSLWASLHGLVSLLIARPDFPWADLEQLVAEHSRLAYEIALR